LPLFSTLDPLETSVGENNCLLPVREIYRGGKVNDVGMVVSIE
jgi:hypothetical protein